MALFIAQHNPKAGFRFLTAASRAFNLLAGMPELGSLWLTRNPICTGIRVWPIRSFKNYLIFYRPLSDGIEVIRVLHAAQDLEGALG